jgi:thiol-disulfide isomerase/thioredoxin
MKLQHPCAVVAAMAAMVVGLTGAICAQEKKEEPKKVPAAKIVPAVPQEKEDDAKEEGPALDIGSKAPDIAVSEWVKGQKIDGFKPGQLYVVEFWATWCGPCKASMPHLAELQTKYGDKVKMIGVSDEETEKVTKFLKEEQSKDKTWDQVVTYALAMDDERKTNDAYMKAAAENGIPTAFIIGKDGVIEWIGHPMSMDDALASVVDGKYDRVAAKSARKEAKEQQLAMMAAQRKFMKAMQSGDTATAIKVLDELLEKQPENLGIAMTKLQVLSQGDDKTASAKYADELAGKVDGMIAKSPDNQQFALLKLDLVAQGSDKGAAAAYVQEILKKYGEDPMVLNQIAWGIAAEKKAFGDLDLALKVAKQGVEVTKEKDGMILDTLARVYFEQGKLDEAIEWQTKAVKVNDRPDIKEALEKYEAAKKEKEEKAKKAG